MLTTQLQHQDPLSPLDTNQFTQQLVQFASVEQQINMNTSLSTLISLQQTQQAINGQSHPLSQITQVLSTGSTSSNPVSQAASAGQNFLNGLTNALTGSQ